MPQIHPMTEPGRDAQQIKVLLWLLTVDPLIEKMLEAEPPPDAESREAWLTIWCRWRTMQQVLNQA